MNFNSQPTSGTVQTERAALFTNDLSSEIEILALNFFNTGGDDNVLVELFQDVKIAQAELDASERFVFDEPLRVMPGQSIEAKSSATGVVAWRVNFKSV